MTIKGQNAYGFLVKTILFITLYLGGQNVSQAQSVQSNELSKTNLYLDVGAIPGVQIAVNIERRIHSGEKITWYARAGAGFAGIVFGDGGPGGLAAATMLTGKSNNHFELSGGAFVGKDSGSNDTFAYPLLDIGYRYQKPAGGFIFKAKIGILGTGIALGYAF